MSNDNLEEMGAQHDAIYEISQLNLLNKKKKPFPLMESKTYPLDSHAWICSLVEPAWSLEEVHWCQWNVQQSKLDFPVDREYPFTKILYIKK